MSGSPTILIVDDDGHLRDVLRFTFEKHGFRVVDAADGKQALERFQETRPDLVVLDILLPEIDGTDVCRAIRSSSSTPILFLTSKSDEIDRVVGLEIGGDDYVTKPFSPRELVARVRAILRRSRPAGDGGAAAVSPRSTRARGRLAVNLDTYQAFWGGEEIVLTVTEFGVLRTLLGYPGKVFTRDELIRGAHAEDVTVTDRTIDSHIRRIRQKFPAGSDSVIETVHGVGYKLGICEP